MNEYVNSVCASGLFLTGADWRSRKHRDQVCAGTILLVPADDCRRRFVTLQKWCRVTGANG